jgi:hypothetical protein
MQQIPLSALLTVVVNYFKKPLFYSNFLTTRIQMNIDKSFKHWVFSLVSFSLLQKFARDLQSPLFVPFTHLPTSDWPCGPTLSFPLTSRNRFFSIQARAAGSVAT